MLTKRKHKLVEIESHSIIVLRILAPFIYTLTRRSKTTNASRHDTRHAHNRHHGRNRWSVGRSRRSSPAPDLAPRARLGTMTVEKHQLTRLGHGIAQDRHTSTSNLLQELEIIADTKQGITQVVVVWVCRGLFAILGRLLLSPRTK